MRWSSPRPFAAALALAVSALGSMSPSPASENTTIADRIRAFDVFAIHLGMTPGQVDAALAMHGFRLSDGMSPDVKDDLTHSGLCVKNYIADLKAGKPVPDSWSADFVGGKDCIYWQQPAYRGDVLSLPRLLIYYCEDYPEHPGIMRVVEINLVESVKTDADAKAFRQAIFSRMGRKPTWESKDQTTGAFCSLNTYSADVSGAFDSSPCQADTTITSFNPGTFDPSKEHGVTLDYSSSAGTMTLQDRDFIITHRTSAWKAIQATHSPTKTPF